MLLWVGRMFLQTFQFFQIGKWGVRQGFREQIAGHGTPKHICPFSTCQRRGNQRNEPGTCWNRRRQRKWWMETQPYKVGPCHQSKKMELEVISRVISPQLLIYFLAIYKGYKLALHVNNDRLRAHLVDKETQVIETEIGCRDQHPTYQTKNLPTKLNVKELNTSGKNVFFWGDRFWRNGWIQYQRSQLLHLGLMFTWIMY